MQMNRAVVIRQTALDDQAGGNAPVLVQTAARKCVKTHQAEKMASGFVGAHRFEPEAAVRCGLPGHGGHVKHVNAALRLRGVQGFHDCNSNDRYHSGN